MPEFDPAPGDDLPDIVLCQGAVPKPASDDARQLIHYIDGAPGRLWLNIPDKLRMLVEDGRRLTYDPCDGVAQDELRLFLLGSGFGALMMQRGALVMHANAIAVPGGAILCVGQSGAGKSTTAVAMMQRGFGILADDVCPLGADGLVLPGMGRAKLWEASLRQLGLDAAPLLRIRASDAKFNLPLAGAHCTTPQPPRAFFWLMPEDVRQVSVTQVRGAERFAVLQNNIYRPEYLRPLGLQASYLQRLTRLAAQIPVFRVSRPQAGFEIEPLLDAILATSQHLEDAPRQAVLK